MPSRESPAGPLRLAFRLALLDAAPGCLAPAARREALIAARDRLRRALEAGVPEARAEDPDGLAAALQAGFEEAWALVADRP